MRLVTAMEASPHAIFFSLNAEYKVYEMYTKVPQRGCSERARLT